MYLNYIALALAAIAAVVALFALAPLRLRVVYRRLGHRDHLALTLGPFWGLLPIKITVPFLNLILRPDRQQLEVKARAGQTPGLKTGVAHKKIPVPNLARVYQALQRWWPVVRAARPAVRYIMARVRLRRLNWRTELGFEDAARTGWAVGVAWAVKGLAMSVLYIVLSPGQRPPRLQVIPDFNQPKLYLDFDCVIELRPVHLLISIFIAACTYLRSRLGRG
ncbi:MAG: DUF2953 domain-containing protein [Bacillota bacterium]